MIMRPTDNTRRQLLIGAASATVPFLAAKLALQAQAAGQMLGPSTPTHYRFKLGTWEVTTILDAGAMLRLVPRGGALLEAFTGEGEAPARVLPPRRVERRHGIRIQGNAATVTRFRRTVIEPGHFPG